jgi:hypothetical protein
VRAFSVAFIVIGVAIVVRTLAAGGGEVGVVLGVGFAAIGAARLWVSALMGR